MPGESPQDPSTETIPEAEDSHLLGEPEIGSCSLWDPFAQTQEEEHLKESSINMDGAAEEWFSEGGPVTSQGSMWSYIFWKETDVKKCHLTPLFLRSAVRLKDTSSLE